MVIAIDGPAGSGKSTIAKLLSEYYHAIFMNTGSFYRALTYSLLQETKKNGVSIDSLKDEYLTYFTKNLKLGYADGNVFLEDIKKDIKHMELRTGSFSIPVKVIEVDYSDRDNTEKLFFVESVEVP